jgi:hypothetical protein
MRHPPALRLGDQEARAHLVAFALARVRVSLVVRVGLLLLLLLLLSLLSLLLLGFLDAPCA